MRSPPTLTKIVAMTSPGQVDYDKKLTQYVEDIATRQEEARNAEERSAARQRIRATFAGAQAAQRMRRLSLRNSKLPAGRGSTGRLRRSQIQSK